MQNTNRIKLYRDHDLWRDVGFLVIAAAFVMVQAFGYSLGQAALYAPLIVGGCFAVLWGVARVLLTFLRLVDGFSTRVHKRSRPARRR